MTEEKTRIHTRISPDTQRKLETAFPNANCRSRNEFVEEAIRFYSDHIISQEITDCKTDEYIKVTESGLNNKVRWGGQYFKWWLEEQPGYALYTRYPE